LKKTATATRDSEFLQFKECAQQRCVRKAKERLGRIREKSENQCQPNAREKRANAQIIEPQGRSPLGEAEQNGPL
jgi:hypothetical protein